MSFDGSFTCESAFRRFLDRSPALRSNSRLLQLSHKGAQLSEDDVVGGLAELFLHPSHTIAVAGCFRPLNQRIVDRAVDLLRLVPRLDFDSNGDFVVEVPDGKVDVVDYYVGRGKGLRLHEVACFAFCRALDLTPFVLGSVLNYFKFSPSPFHRFSTTASSSHIFKADLIPIVHLLGVSFRYLMIEPEIFSELWNWSPMLDLHKIYDNAELSANDILDIRWYKIQICSIVLRMSDMATRKAGLRGIEAFACFLRWKEFCLDTIMEKASWYYHTSEQGSKELFDGHFASYEKSPKIPSIFPYKKIEVESKPRIWEITSCDAVSKRNAFILTTSLHKSYEMALLALSQKWPILLHGPAGSGKTSLVKALSAAAGHEVLFIHLDEQMDAKTLIGTYVSSEHPGQFKWQPGSLTQAVLKGFWIVFEDIDKAPSEVHSILMPLLECSNSFPTGRGEGVAVAESFRLFSTVSISGSGHLHNKDDKTAGSILWRKVQVPTQSNDDLFKILIEWFPCLKPCAGKLIDTLHRANSLACTHAGVFQAGTECPHNTTIFSLRHLLKLCRRIEGFISNRRDTLLMSDCKQIFQEAVDIFASYSSSPVYRLSMTAEISKIWGIMIEDENLLSHEKPLFQNCGLFLQVGRVTLQSMRKQISERSMPFIHLRSSLLALEKIACCIKYNEPVLLVGETGTGKTTLIQNLALRLGQPLVVLNLSQQSDIADLLGSFKPTDAPSICTPLYNEFLDIFCKTYQRESNAERLFRYEKLATSKRWKKLLEALKICVSEVLKLAEKRIKSDCSAKRKRSWSKILDCWESLSCRLELASRQIDGSYGMSFSFVEGAFVNALKKGQWILLDEINLAPPETLQRIIGVLDGENSTMCLVERGDINYVERHSSFRLFACMNPATDAGKRDLPHSIRSRFTEFFIDDALDSEDLTLFVRQHMEDISVSGDIIKKVVSFYQEAKHEAEVRLQDGANQKPQFSLRSLARALKFTRKAEKEFGFRRALYDGFCMFFLTLLDEASKKSMKRLIVHHLLEGMLPDNMDNLLERYLTSSLQPVTASSDIIFCESYVMTKSVEENLRNIARAVYIKKYPVLLQGPTSSGKTSLVRYLAFRTGHEFVRINNHEHTDLQEYFGSYVSNSHGRLEFQEGALVKAVRKGHWIVLDELNLAPSDVLEALNRLLDDNRELFIPELQETIVPHPDFMLFATQNPPSLYGGRKMLSRAFRNRFLEIHVPEIPEDELSAIIKERCKIAGSFAEKMVAVMKDLQLHRQNSNVFAGKHGFITPRDLFRWANRFNHFGENAGHLAKEGYLLLSERLREESEKKIVQEVLETRFRVKLLIDNLYKEESPLHCGVLNINCLGANSANLVWTKSIERLYFLLERCYKLREPVLLVGETGGGKTSACQLLASMLGLRLHILNCHQYTETSDFLGGFHPVRDRSRLINDFRDLTYQLHNSKVFIRYASDHDISSDIEKSSSSLYFLDEILNKCGGNLLLHPDITQQDLDHFVQLRLELLLLVQRWHALFFWQDGPLVQAMKDGDLFLIDEISLADDSVLERLNSVLEPERTLSLAEKGGSNLERVIAHSNFLVLATMNPGGDFGKRELSPALRNRFTEIWVPPVIEQDELRSIALNRFGMPELSNFVDPLLTFWEWFNKLGTGRTLTVRDLLSWVTFINVAAKKLGYEHAFIHGGFLVLLDGLSLGTGMSKTEVTRLRESCFSYLFDCLKRAGISLNNSELTVIENFGWGGDQTPINNAEADVLSHLFGIKPFYIEKGPLDCQQDGFEFLAPTTRKNALRVLRAMQLPKPVLLEGSPGVGKTSLIVAMAKYSGHRVVRINLSEQTDMMDLLGSDLPTDNDDQFQFAWSDGILLQAIKEGSWVLLDELNLAPQSVLEGLNAILDHRTEVYIPELNLTFKCPPSFRVFACQNPSYQGGGRKGLPKSFLNRFTKVYADELTTDDYFYICHSLHPSIPDDFLQKLIDFNYRIYNDTMVLHKYGQDGSPWEFNLRDVLRSCQIIEGASDETRFDSFLNIVYFQRMRTTLDRKEVLKCYEDLFGRKPRLNMFPKVTISSEHFFVGSVDVKRRQFQPSKRKNIRLNVLPQKSHVLEVVLHCIKHQWLCILVGPPSSGKTSIIRLSAQVTGNCLREVNLSSGTEISELLGGFEQYGAHDNLKLIIRKVDCYVHEYCCLRLESKWANIIRVKESVIDLWLTFMASNPASTFANRLVGQPTLFLNPLIEVIELLKLDLERYQLPVAWSLDDLDILLKNVLQLQKYVGQVQTANFKWVSGELIRAIENGDWLVLENANLCNPSVLDRINSLVEPSGSITINECGLVDGKPLVLNAHPNFRLFLTLDPRHGEVSRAMRNRGVEIFVMEADKLLSEECGYFVRENEISDVKLFLLQSGIPALKLANAMCEAHDHVKSSGQKHGTVVTFLELTRWVQLFQQLLVHGNHPLWSLLVSFEQTYLSLLGESIGGDIIAHAKCYYLSDSKWFTSEDGFLSLSAGWPLSPSPREMLWFSEEFSIMKNFLYLASLGVQYASFNISDAFHQKISLVVSRNVNTRITPMELIRQFFSTFSVRESSKFSELLMFIAAGWTFEQARHTNLELYVQLFRWYSMLLHPYCEFFNLFANIIEKEQTQHFWNCIYDTWHVVTEQNPVSLCLGGDALVNKRSQNAVNCLAVRWHFLLQQNVELGYKSPQELSWFLPFFDVLRHFEEKLFDAIIESPMFDDIIKVFSSLLDNHIALWKSITTQSYEHGVFAWRALMKMALMLQRCFPEVLESFLVESSEFSLKATKHFGMNLGSSARMLWQYGGRPFVPSSRMIYLKLQQLLAFCNSIWPASASWDHARTESCARQQVALSSVVELKELALQGFCFVPCIILRHGTNEKDIEDQIDQIYQGLVERVEFERSNLQLVALSIAGKSYIPASKCPRVCCELPPQILCESFGFDSWLVTRPLFDIISISLDMGLLRELSKSSLVDHSATYEAVNHVYSRMQFALDYSLKYSTRSPMDFASHQKILWLIDSWGFVNSAPREIANSLHEMWFKWHSALWSYSFENQKGVSASFGNSFCRLLQPIRMSSIDHMLKKPCPVIEFNAQKSKLRVASRTFCEDEASGENLIDNLLSVARSLFEQIICIHKKYFEEGKFRQLMSLLLFSKDNPLTDDKLQILQSVVSNFTHKMSTEYPFFAKENIVQSLLKALYSEYPSSVFHCNIGIGWFCIGLLRFSLLLDEGGPDPTLKYSFKHGQVLEKISVLAHEKQVRGVCEGITGNPLLTDSEVRLINSMRKLILEQERLKGKIVFRNNPDDYRRVSSDCRDFLDVALKGYYLVKQLETGNVNVSGIANEACNWQDTAMCFIGQLTQEYPSFVDIIQPIQVAIFEMKFGLSLVTSNFIQCDFLVKFGDVSAEKIYDAVFTLMKFPRVHHYEECSVGRSSMISTSMDHISRISERMSLLLKLGSVKTDSSCDSMDVDLQLQVSMFHIILCQLNSELSNSLLLHNASFKMLCDTFDQIANLWYKIRTQAKAMDDSEHQMFRFRPRAVTIEDFMDDLPIHDNAELDDISSEEEFLEMKLMKMQEITDKGKHLKEECEEILEVSLNSVVHIHNQMFGSSLIKQATDEDRLRLFIASYSLGIRILKVLPSALSTALDQNFVTEYMFRLSLEYGQNMKLIHQPSSIYNIYKDPNPPEISKIVAPLFVFQQRVKSLYNEWPGHPGLQKLLDVVEVLLQMPQETPVSKVLSGLHMLIGKANQLQENFSRNSFSDVLEPIYSLALSWQRQEIESWSVLLDEIQGQYQKNAMKLWYPLYSLLHRNIFDDANKLTIESLEEYVQTANAGEFEKRLQLIIAFHGHFKTIMHMNTCSSPYLKDHLNILYNATGYYVQFLPIVLEHINSGRRSIESEVKDLLKLLRWEKFERNYLFIENFRRTKQKFCKLIKKFNVVLELPIMVIIKDALVIKESKFSSWLEQKPSDQLNKKPMDCPFDLTQFDEKERSECYDEWKNKVGSMVDIPQISGESGLRLNSLSALPECKKDKSRWEEGWITLEIISRNACEFAKTLKYAEKNLKKRRALSDFLKILRKCGLSHRKSFFEDPRYLFLLPSYKMEHLLFGGGNSFGSNDSNTPSNYRNCSQGRFSSKWQSANRYYFMNVVMAKHLEQISCKFHKDLTSEQVKCACSFFIHLLMVQQEQRSVAYSFSDQLKGLKKGLLSLEHIGKGDFFLVSNQFSLLNCMWQQKGMFDCLHSLCKDVLLFLQSVGHTHSSDCDLSNFGSGLSCLLNKFDPMFLQSKELLDKYLVGEEGIMVIPSECLPVIITREIESAVFQNFKTIVDFDESIQNLLASEVSHTSIFGRLLKRFKSVADQGRLLMNGLHRYCKSEGLPVDFVESDPSIITSNRQCTEFYQSFVETRDLIMGLLLKSNTAQSISERYDIQNITSYKDVFESYIAELQLHDVHHVINKTVISVRNLLSDAEELDPKILCAIGVHLKHIIVLLDLHVTFGYGILLELITMHKTVTEMSLFIAHIFASLISKGFGNTEELVDSSSSSKSQDAGGTGLGEGEGVNDVSDQIDDESQIPSGSNKETEQTEGVDHSDTNTRNDSKGIELDDDFEAETFSIDGDSDISDHEGDNDEDVNLDSAMGDAGEGNEVQEKHCGKDEDDVPEGLNEKYECGPSVSDSDTASKELRGKDEDSTQIDDSDTLDNQQNELTDKEKETNGSVSDHEDNSKMEMNMNDAYEDPTGIEIDKNESADALDGMDETQATEEAVETNDSGIDDVAKDGGNEMDVNESEENLDVTEFHPSDFEEKDEERDSAEKMDEDLPDTSKTISETKPGEVDDQTTIDVHPAEFPNGASTNNEDMTSAVSYTNEMPVKPSDGIPLEGSSKMEMHLPDSIGESNVANGQPKGQSSQNDLSLQRILPSPYRSLGDALEKWKERVRIAPDLQAVRTDSANNLEDENADEYQFVPETEVGNSQALGSALPNQVMDNAEKVGLDKKDSWPEADSEMPDILKDDSKKQCAKALENSIVKPETERASHKSSLPCEMSEEVERNVSGANSESLVSFQRDFLQENAYNHNFESSEKIDHKRVDIVQLPDDEKSKAIGDWRQYELAAAKLSQELAEQLRLVLEPTLASKLQGDYKTGKRINMKKVITYIASHFRRDKIWLRRTKPNRRDYQVVIAVDDSRSMSESHCGNFAIEALVTVCCAMPQLEVGQIAVTSFGTKGNIQLLHDFDMPFSAEAGAKMISSFSFKQDNTITDEPMVDLLKYLNDMLDASVSKSRLPSGSNPLQQLILIIADGHFHDKENVRRYVRNVLSSKRMIAFLLLDNPEDSIVTRSEVFFEEGKINSQRYMNSFPFPYYGVLRNIEMLPRTLANLLRQWFELAQNANE